MAVKVLMSCRFLNRLLSKIAFLKLRLAFMVIYFSNNPLFTGGFRVLRSYMWHGNQM